MDHEAIHRANLDLMASVRTVYLTTVDEHGFPHTRAMLNLRNTDLYPMQAKFCDGQGSRMAIFLTTNTSSRKAAQIKANPKVSAYFCRPASFHGVMLSGEVDVVDDCEVKRSLWDSSWQQFYPKGPDDPDHTVLRLVPVLVRGWNRGTKFEYELE